MDIFGKVIAIAKADAPITTSDGRSMNLYDVTISVPEVHSMQTSGQPYIEGRVITASVFQPVNMELDLAVGAHIAAFINVTSKFNQTNNRYFNRVSLVRFVDLAKIEWNW